MEPFGLISKYFWLIAILVTGINFIIFRKRAQKYIKEDPQLEVGYAPLFRGYLFWMNIPWIIMGIGCTIGGVTSIWHYFRPKDGNPFVLAWFGSLFLIWILGTWWLFFRGGAEKLVQYPGMLEFRYGFKGKNITNPVLIKTFWVLALAGGIVAVVLMWSMQIQIPTFR
jgi:hypothetical protein